MCFCLSDHVRVLPLLLCGNPTHYGAPNILTCAEALAGALFIAGIQHQQVLRIVGDSRTLLCKDLSLLHPSSSFLPLYLVVGDPPL